MLNIRSGLLFALLAISALIFDCHAQHTKKPIPFDSSSIKKRNIGGHLKDWYLSKMTHNYMCTDTGRLVPVDPETGHMLLKGLRKRNWVDDMVGKSHETETGSCRNPTWVLPIDWTQPIPVTQFLAQYPWMTVDEYGQIHFNEDYRQWLEQRGAQRATANQAQGGVATAAQVGSGVVPDGGVGYVPPSYLNVAATSGLGTASFGNGVTAGTAAHV